MINKIFWLYFCLFSYAAETSFISFYVIVLLLCVLLTEMSTSSLQWHYLKQPKGCQQVSVACILLK